MKIHRCIAQAHCYLIIPVIYTRVCMFSIDVSVDLSGLYYVKKIKIKNICTIL